jgi:hypothetical protein
MLTYIKIKCFKDNFGGRFRTQPHFYIVMSACWQLLHKPRRVVEGTASVESTTALAIPERILGVKLVFKMLLTGRITEVVIANKWRDWYGDVIIDIYAWT